MVFPSVLNHGTNDPLSYHQSCDMAGKFVQTQETTLYDNIPQMVSVSA